MEKYNRRQFILLNVLFRGLSNAGPRAKSAPQRKESPLMIELKEPSLKSGTKARVLLPICKYLSLYVQSLCSIEGGQSPQFRTISGKHMREAFNLEITVFLSSECIQ